jgi:hypothetical protein
MAVRLNDFEQTCQANRASGSALIEISEQIELIYMRSLDRELSSNETRLEA